MVTGRTAALLGTSIVPGGVAVWYGIAPWAVVSVATTVIVLLLSVDLALAANPRAIKVSRTGAGTVRLGETAQAELIVHNTDDSIARILLRDAWVPSAGATPSTHVLTMRPGQKLALGTDLTPTRRGDRPAVYVAVRCFGPLRLTFRQAVHRPEWTLRVLPRFESRKHLPEKLAKLRIVEGAIAIRGRGQGTEFDTLREYVPGDDVRSIDWRATARRGDVMLRTWRPERSRRVVCVIDTGRTSAVRVARTHATAGKPRLSAATAAGGRRLDPANDPRLVAAGDPSFDVAAGDPSFDPEMETAGEPRLDAAIEAALLLAAVAQEAGDQVDLLAVDSRVRAAVSGAGVRHLLPRLVNALAPLHPALVETDFELVASEVLRRERKRCLVVIFTALEPGALGEGLLPVLPKLVARHQVLVAAVHDPALTELAATPVDSADAAYSVAAGTRALLERRRISTALSRNGVSVLDCPVDVFASEVTDAYLALKAAGRL